MAATGARRLAATAICARRERRQAGDPSEPRKSLLDLAATTFGTDLSLIFEEAEQKDLEFLAARAALQIIRSHYAKPNSVS
jgi:hypothetical protein